MKKIFFYATTLLVCNNLFAQQFIDRYNGTGNGIDAVKAMYVDNAGNSARGEPVLFHCNMELRAKRRQCHTLPRWVRPLLEGVQPCPS